MTLTKIKFFLEVARQLNFTKAAESLFIAQPNLSKHISQMEEEIGVQLFVRTKRSVRLTEAGSLLAEELEGVPQLVENAFEQARALAKGETGRLSIGILEAQDMNKFLLDNLLAFEKQFPHVELILDRSGFSRLRKGLGIGYYDAIITMDFDVAAEKNFDHKVILQQQGTIAINRHNPLAEKSDLTLQDLKDENFVVISAEESPMGYRMFMDQMQEAGIKPNIVRELTSLESLILCVETGIGITLLDHNTRLENNREVSLVTIPDSRYANLVVAWRKGDTKPVVESLLRALDSDQKK